jgi:hypothetical protein
MRSALSMIAFTMAVLAEPAAAESGTRSRDYVFAAGGLSRSASVYQNLFRTCVATLGLPNVKDAFILADGAVAAVPAIDSVGATAGTLAEFCMRFPRATLHFVEHTELRHTADIGRAVRLSSSTSTSCPKILGNQ